MDNPRATPRSDLQFRNPVSLPVTHTDDMASSDVKVTIQSNSASPRQRARDIRLNKVQLLLVIAGTSLCWICLDIYLFYCTGIASKTGSSSELKAPRESEVNEWQWMKQALENPDLDFNLNDPLHFLDKADDAISDTDDMLGAQHAGLPIFDNTPLEKEEFSDGAGDFQSDHYVGNDERGSEQGRRLIVPHVHNDRPENDEDAYMQDEEAGQDTLEKDSDSDIFLLDDDALNILSEEEKNIDGGAAVAKLQQGNFLENRPDEEKLNKLEDRAEVQKLEGNNILDDRADVESLEEDKLEDRVDVEKLDTGKLENRENVENLEGEKLEDKAEVRDLDEQNEDSAVVEKFANDNLGDRPSAENLNKDNLNDKADVGKKEWIPDVDTLKVPPVQYKEHPNQTLGNGEGFNDAVVKLEKDFEKIAEAEMLPEAVGKYEQVSLYFLCNNTT